MYLNLCECTFCIRSVFCLEHVMSLKRKSAFLASVIRNEVGWFVQYFNGVKNSQLCLIIGGGGGSEGFIAYGL